MATSSSSATTSETSSLPDKVDSLHVSPVLGEEDKGQKKDVQSENSDGDNDYVNITRKSEKSIGTTSNGNHVGNGSRSDANGKSSSQNGNATSPSPSTAPKKSKPLDFLKNKKIPKREDAVKSPTSPTGASTTTTSSKTNENPSTKPGTIPEIKVEQLPQSFVARFLGSRPCTGLWGIQHTRKPVDDLLASAGTLTRKADDLPSAQLTVTYTGIELTPLSGGCKSRPDRRPMDVGLIPLEFISYAVQDVRNPRVFAFVLVREMSAKDRVLECHAYLCDQPATARTIALSVAVAFEKYAEKLQGKPYRFKVELQPCDDSHLANNGQTDDCEV